MNQEISYGRRMMMGEEELEQHSNTSEKVDFITQWNQINRDLGIDLSEDIDVPEPFHIRFHESEADQHLYIPSPSTVSHAQREPSEWAKKFVWGNNAQPQPKKPTTARIWRERKPVVPVLDEAFGNEFFLDEVREAYAEAIGIDSNEIQIYLPESEVDHY